LWNDAGATADDGSTFFINEADYTLFPDEYKFEYTPVNANTLWYTTSSKTAGASNPWQEYALPLGNGELGCMVFGEVQKEEIQFNEKTLWSGEANKIGAGGGDRTFVNFGSIFIINNDDAIYDGVTDYVRYLDLEEGVAGIEFKNAKGKKK
jgi:alpha-L-fucosidase 2